ncbi:hypothetical protein FGO68_gene16367 [Halteria grandinella]|uniref:CWH43-like N-terminal domain-containing protein n=1 Tax=Halteria grandinella TaxID=5974 RepID=A0A8J8P3U5_HALGN|nr:hypothetical protein FGO68_gene16367 [Halteria grandinella]
MSQILPIPYGQMVQQQPCTCYKHQQATPKKSVFERWFVDEDGSISVSLRNLTIVSALSVSVSLLTMLYFSCNDGTGEYVCTYEKFPMISDVIHQEMYDRTFLLITTIFMYGVQQVNIRAYFKKLYGLVSDQRNDTMMVFGIIALVALPMVGIFDNKNWIHPHVICAAAFFLSFTIYGWMLASSLESNKDKFPQSEQAQIDTIGKASTFMVCLTAAFGILEWATVLYYVNYFSITSFVNPFYDSIHEFKANKAIIV